MEHVITRRRFLGAVAAVPIAATLPTSKPKLAFHPDAFRMVMDDLVPAQRFVSRMDVLYGWRALHPELACRIENA